MELFSLKVILGQKGLFPPFSGIQAQLVVCWAWKEGSCDRVGERGCSLYCPWFWGLAAAMSWEKLLGCHNSVTMKLPLSSGSSWEMQEAGSWLCCGLLSSGKGDGVIFSAHLRSPPSVGTWVSVSESSCRRTSAALP